MNNDYIYSILNGFKEEMLSMKGQTETSRCIVMDKYALALDSYIAGRVKEVVEAIEVKKKETDEI